METTAVAEEASVASPHHNGAESCELCAVFAEVYREKNSVASNEDSTIRDKYCVAARALIAAAAGYRRA